METDDLYMNTSGWLFACFTRIRFQGGQNVMESNRLFILHQKEVNDRLNEFTTSWKTNTVQILTLLISGTSEPL